MLFSNLFNTAKVLTAGIVETVMGEPATWEENQVAGFGLYRNPTGPEMLAPSASRADGAEYNSELPTFRYKSGEFPGLYEYVRAGESATIVRQVENRRYLCSEIKRIFDGDTYLMLLEPLPYAASIPNPTPGP